MTNLDCIKLLQAKRQVAVNWHIEQAHLQQIHDHYHAAKQIKTVASKVSDPTS